MYKKIKTVSLKLDNKIKKELEREKLENIEEGGNLGEGKHLRFLGALVSSIKVNLIKLKILYLGLLSFVVSIALTISKHIFVVFGDPANAFNVLYNQHQAVSCPVPYSQFKKAQRHAKVFSYAGLATMILMLSFSTMITNFLMGPTEKIVAAGYNLVQESWTTLSSDVAHHSNGDGSGWIKYSAKTNIEAGETIAISLENDSWNETTDADFNSYTSKDASLLVVSNSIKLLKPNDARCSADNECETDICDCRDNTCNTSTGKSVGEACSSNSECCTSYCNAVCSYPLVLFYASGSYNGNLGGRSGADTKCRAGGAPSGYNSNNIHAFITVNSSDEIRDMPTKYSIPTNRPVSVWKSSIYTQVGNNWADLLDGEVTFEAGLNDELILTTKYVTGSNNSGAIYSTTGHIQDAASCHSWTNSTVLSLPRGGWDDSYTDPYGATIKTSGLGRGSVSNRCNGSGLRLLCIGF
ncbi:hypothetical protein HOD96_02765 [Candidatus Falkowbacteria bacterium]|jgi:hypothetical protein|nr:hypothetical protein [Candidatus Falkowbacteria bacterium]MBT4433501.1 hypothetical protein [Candidatus Falkowbacteria bacterium]